MTPKTKEHLDDLENIAHGINNSIENEAISGRACELHSFCRGTDKIISTNLTRLLVNGLSAELRSMEGYVTRREEQGQVDIDTAIEIIERIHQIRKRM